MSKTGEINSNIEQILNPKCKANRAGLKKYSMKNGDTFARSKGIIPDRWSQSIVANSKQKTDGRFDKMAERLRGFKNMA